MQTFIFNPADRNDTRITLSGTEAKHAASVLRLGKGDTIRLIDGSGEAHISEIVDLSPKSVTCSIIKTIRNGGETSLRVTLAAGISSASKFDSIIEKGTEIGVAAFVPLLTQKAKVKLEKSSAMAGKMKRWSRVCEAAVKQSGRSKFPHIVEPVSFTEFINGLAPEQSVLFHPESPTTTLAEFITTYDQLELTVITGPESGFSKDELALAGERNIPVINLGERILRTETAAVVCSSLLIYFKESFKR